MEQVSLGTSSNMVTRTHTHHTFSWLVPCVRRLAAAAVFSYCLSVPAGASAATYYLNTGSGSDSSPGTSAAPWKTLTKVQSSAADGDTVVIQWADATTYAAKWPAQASYRAKVLQQFAVTWTFDAEYPVGQFNTGDFWVAGPVKIVGIDPPSTPIDGRTMNGSMVNPAAGWNPQGYDSAMPSNPYDPALNVALGVSGSNPLVLAPNSSLISTISVTKAGSIPQLQRAVILTVLDSPAAPGSFRPPYCGTDKAVRFNKSALDYSRLKKLTPVTGTPALSDVEAQFAAPWIEHQGSWTATALRPSLNMPYYGRDMHGAIGMAALMLHLNFTDAQKEKLLVEFVQLGIDLYGVLINGGASNWSPDGGQAGGRKWPILFAGLLLNDSAMRDVGRQERRLPLPERLWARQSPAGSLLFRGGRSDVLCGPTRYRRHKRTVLAARFPGHSDDSVFFVRSRAAGVGDSAFPVPLHEQQMVADRVPAGGRAALPWYRPGRPANRRRQSLVESQRLFRLLRPLHGRDRSHGRVPGMANHERLHREHVGHLPGPMRTYLARREQWRSRAGSHQRSSRSPRARP